MSTKTIIITSKFSSDKVDRFIDIIVFKILVCIFIFVIELPGYYAEYMGI